MIFGIFFFFIPLFFGLFSKNRDFYGLEFFSDHFFWICGLNLQKNPKKRPFFAPTPLSDKAFYGLNERFFSKRRIRGVGQIGAQRHNFGFFLRFYGLHRRFFKKKPGLRDIFCPKNTVFYGLNEQNGLCRSGAQRHFWPLFGRFWGGPRKGPFWALFG